MFPHDIFATAEPIALKEIVHLQRGVLNEDNHLVAHVENPLPVNRSPENTPQPKALRLPDRVECQIVQFSSGHEG